MSLFQRYIATMYFKNVFVIFVGLVVFYTSVDLMVNISSLPESANLKLIYASLNALSSVNYALPLSIVFGMIVTKFSMIRSNELISMYAAGISKTRLLKPLLVVSFLLSFGYIGLNFTPFVYAYEFRSNILKNNTIAPISTGLFLKYENSYVYIDKLDPIQQKAYGLKIFDVENRRLNFTIEAKEGTFFQNAWTLKDITKITKPHLDALSEEGLVIENLDSLTTLQGFKPKIIENSHQGTLVLSILDAVDAMRFFSSQNMDYTWIRASLYSMIFFPLFAPLVLIILYVYLPVSSRFFNLTLLSFIFVIVTLLAWAILFVMTKFSINGVISPEIGIAAPILLMALHAMYLYAKQDKLV